MATTENMRVLTDQQTSTVASNVQGVQQARRLANASTVSPTVRHQRSVQADPNKLSKSLESIGNAVGNIAQDTYSLNNALVDEMISDDTAMMVHGLDEMDKSLKPGESRDNIIKVAGSYRAELMAKKGDFGGNADMQARYRERFVNPSAAQTMGYIKEWQKQEYGINLDKLQQSFDEYKTKIYPKLLANVPEGSTGRDQIIASAQETIDGYIRDLATLGEFKAPAHRLTLAQSMTNSFDAEINGDINKYISSGKESLVDIQNGEINKKNLATLWNDKYFYFGKMDDNLKINYRTKDAAVDEEISGGLQSLIGKLQSGRSQKVEEHNKTWQYLIDSAATPGSNQSIKIGNVSFKASYGGRDVELSLQQNRNAFIQAFGYPPTVDQESQFRNAFNKTDAEVINDSAFDYYSKNFESKIDYNRLNKDSDIKMLHKNRSNMMYFEREDAMNVLGDKNSSPFLIEEANKSIIKIDKMLRNPAFAGEASSYFDDLKKSIFTDPTSSSSYDTYISNKGTIQSQTGREYMRNSIGSPKEYEKSVLYMTLYDAWEKNQQDKKFAIEPERQAKINRMADGQLSEEEINQVRSWSLVDDTMSDTKYMTPVEIDKELSMNKNKKLVDNDYKVNKDKREFGSVIEIPNSTSPFVALSNTVTGYGGRSSFISKKLQLASKDGKFVHMENLEKKVYSSIIVRAERSKNTSQIEAAGALLAEGFMLQEIDGTNGEFQVLQKDENGRMVEKNLTVDLFEYANGDGSLTEAEKEVMGRPSIRKQKAANAIYKSMGVHPSDFKK